MRLSAAISAGTVRSASASRSDSNRCTSAVCASRARGGGTSSASADGSQPARHEQIDGGARGGVADAGEKQEDAEPAHLVARVLEDAEEREHVLHVRGLEELEAAPFLEGDLAIRELDLEVGGHVAGAEEHRHLAQRRALLVELEDPVHHPAGLLVLVARGHERGRLAASAPCEEVLGEALRARAR